MAKDAKGHGSEKRGGGSGQTSGHTPEPPFKSRFAGQGVNYLEPNDPRGIGRRQAAMARLEASGKIPAGTLSTVAGLLGAHSSGVAAVGQPAPAPKFGLNSYTHEIVSPTGDVAARMRLGKSNGIAVDEGKGGGISRNSGTALHDAVAMADYRAHIGSSPSFPADRIGGELHYMTGNDFAGHTVRRVKG